MVVNGCYTQKLFFNQDNDSTKKLHQLPLWNLADGWHGGTSANSPSKVAGLTPSQGGAM